MRKINFIFLLIVFSLLLLSAGTIAFAQNTKKTLELPEFKGIYLNANYTVMLKQTNKQEVVVEALTELYEATEIKVENGILLINMERKSEPANKSLWGKIDDIKVNPTMKIWVSVRNISELQVNGGGKLISENSIASEYMSLSVAGSGSLDVDVKGHTMKCEVSGTGSVTLRGYASTLDATLSGSGHLKGFECPLESAKIKVTGTGDAELLATESLDALVYGSGSIKVKGNTRSLTKKVYGPGLVDRAY